MIILELIALMKKHFETKEWYSLGIFSIIVFILLKIAFYKEPIGSLLHIFGAILWLFILPGYVFMLRWKANIAFLERIIMGMVISAGLTGIMSYYIGLLGLHIKYHFIVIPLFLISIGILLSLKAKKN